MGKDKGKTKQKCVNHKCAPKWLFGAHVSRRHKDKDKNMIEINMEIRIKIKMEIKIKKTMHVIKI